MWVQPIYDRTAQDILDETPKAFLNAADLQRISGNIVHVGGLIGVAVPAQTWAREDYFTPSKAAAMLQQINALVAAYYTKTDTPPVPTYPLNYYEKINAIEKILEDLKELAEANKNATIYTGEMWTGQGIGVL